VSSLKDLWFRGRIAGSRAWGTGLAGPAFPDSCRIVRAGRSGSGTGPQARPPLAAPQASLMRGGCLPTIASCRETEPDRGWVVLFSWLPQVPDVFRCGSAAGCSHPALRRSPVPSGQSV